jgi:hypothetical protein
LVQVVALVAVAVMGLAVLQEVNLSMLTEKWVLQRVLDVVVAALSSLLLTNPLKATAVP